MDIVYIETEKLIPYERNNKIHTDDQVNKIANSIKEFWFVQPVVIDKSNIVIIWHGRLLAAKQLKMEKLPCYKLEDLTDEQVKKLRILDNKLNESERDMKNLEFELQQLGDLNMWELKFTVQDIFPELFKEDKEETEIEEDSPVETKSAKIVQIWDLFLLWEHRLLCWDSSKIEDIELVKWWEEFDMVFTDPPYNIWYSGIKDKRSIQNDKMSDSDFISFLKNTLQYCDVSYVCCSRQYAHLFKQAMTELWMPPKAMIVWNKVNPAQNLDKYFKQHEIIFYYGPYGGEKTLRWDIRECKRQKNTIHPTMKPIELISMALEDNPDKKIVFDWFWGSGSTLIACEQLHKKCQMIELDPKYVEATIKRFHNLNPKAEIKCLNRDINIEEILSV